MERTACNDNAKRSLLGVWPNKDYLWKNWPVKQKLKVASSSSSSSSMSSYFEFFILVIPSTLPNEGVFDPFLTLLFWAEVMGRAWVQGWFCNGWIFSEQLHSCDSVD